ncbi:MAG: DNA-directed RNA polymerase subunit A' [Nitrospiraceae bacterium]|nr:DNA-directed RNA polymerase subunit A' [Nitrospiraceae bacterium]
MSAPKRIARIKFGLISPQEYRNMSVTRIITADTYDEDGFPIDMGLMDPRLGVIDPGLRCKTCNGRAGECPGHFGHIELVAPCVHVGFARQIRNILRSTCRSCSRLLIEPVVKKEHLEQIEALRSIGQPIDPLVEQVFSEATKVDVCPYCGEHQLKIVYEKPTTYNEDGNKLLPSDIRDRFERVPDEDIVVFGMDPENARPEWMILTVLPVPPVTVRPSITLQTGQRSEDDLTHKLVDIIRINQRFQENKEAGAPQLIIEDLWELLQYHITTFLDNSVSGIPPARHRSGRPLKTLSQRLKGKDGRFRGSLSGKRVNFSGRTVISPDPNLSINEVGVPEAIAKELTYTLKVVPRNIEELREYVRRGPDNHPGANYVVRADEHRLRISDVNCEELAEMLECGWFVNRHLKDGDIVLFNRQPSLHKMSIMAHEVKVMPGKTFRLNPAVCPPYNADFDGDEMNIHVQQSEEARAEAKILMRVQENILSPRFGGPIIGGIHDHITGMFLLTREKRIDKNSALDILRKTGIRDLPPPDHIEDDVPYWTGKQIFSQILPDSLNLEYKAEICKECDVCEKKNCPYDAYVVIKNGELLCGTVDEKSIGAFKGVIVNKIIREFGATAGAGFVDNMTNLAIRGIMYHGFSFGIDDEDIPEDATKQIQEINKEAMYGKEGITDLIDKYEHNELERTTEETLELRIMQVLGRVRDMAGDTAGLHLGIDNSAVAMAVSGARGSMLNLSQMAACVGQQAVRGERIRRGYADRTLPHFKKGDLGADAHGFVHASYKTGLSPTEYFFHAVGGREGLVDTAVRTSQSGYLQRRMVNALQDLEAQHDGTVRDTRGMVVQTLFGDDGVDPARGFGREHIQRIVKDVTEAEE